MLSSGIIHNICDICVLLVATSRRSTKSSKRYVIRKLLRVVTTYAANSLTNKQSMRKNFQGPLEYGTYVLRTPIAKLIQTTIASRIIASSKTRSRTSTVSRLPMRDFFSHGLTQKHTVHIDSV